MLGRWKLRHFVFVETPNCVELRPTVSSPELTNYKFNSSHNDPISYDLFKCHHILLTDWQTLHPVVSLGLHKFCPTYHQNYWLVFLQQKKYLRLIYAVFKNARIAQNEHNKHDLFVFFLLRRPLLNPTWYRILCTSNTGCLINLESRSRAD